MKCQKYTCNDIVNNTDSEAEMEQEYKVIILKVIYIWYEYRYQTNIPEINKDLLEAIPLETALERRDHGLRRTFKHFDKNKDDKLTEEYEFRFLMEDIDHLFTSKPTFLNLFSIFDEDDDKFIMEEEWLAGFNDLEPSRDKVVGSGVHPSVISPSVISEATIRSRRESRRSALKVIKRFAKKLHRKQ
ncbi:uncharacterized protein [Dysidea avara]